MACSPPSSLAASPLHTAGSNARLFQPPKSPVTTNVTPYYANAGDYFSTGSRKRLRPDASRAHDRYLDQNHSQPHNPRTTSWAGTPAWQLSTPTDSIHGSPFEEDSAFVNERYRLAGGFDTPSLPQEPVIENEHVFRRRLRDDDMDRFVGGDCVFGPLSRERNGVGRVLGTGNGESSRNTWTGLAFGAIGIVGKVFSFGTTVVRGFYAGGGKGYDIHNETSPGLVTPNTLLRQAAASSIPGSWANEDELLGEEEPSYFTSPAQEMPSTTQEMPSNKRRQTDRDEWVVIGTPDTEEGPNANLKRRISSNNVPRSSLAVTASRASSRRNLAPVTRRPSSYANVNGSPAQRNAQPGGGHSRRASIAPSRSPQACARPGSGGSAASQMSQETERFAKRQAKQERQVDKTMSSMEQRMKAMIQQAQQALGTKYSVEGDNNMDLADDGFSSDEGW
ncbi:uncharacterized protein RCC_03634 [Ramularia collo-cygni]|uniref:Uncharacterized protein n=1 Tax=Ramularia collo-cygni TaxID=112498 RepID=A0A2D3USK6_9PEZI|nr:uncharacterized protein RCC_03634 [Ramularia collo-cygni]CZT17798.1 uncharacterized protein RCC_03634 [Ramularia collo-cygni]